MGKRLTLAEFRRTARIVLEADEERIEYIGGACRIDLVCRKPGNPAKGIFCLTIANQSAQGFDLARFECELHAWARSEGLA